MTIPRGMVLLYNNEDDAKGGPHFRGALRVADTGHLYWINAWLRENGDGSRLLLELTTQPMPGR